MTITRHEIVQLLQQGKSLAKADLQSLDLHSLDLSGVNFTGANLIQADLCHSNLTGAKLTGADLRAANLTGANLTQALLADSLLFRANLQGCCLSQAQLEFERATDSPQNSKVGEELDPNKVTIHDSSSHARMRARGSHSQAFLV